MGPTRLKSRVKSGRAQEGIELSTPLALTKGTFVVEELHKQPWWNRLDDDTKTFLEAEGPALASDLGSFGQARINLAARLTKAYERLGPEKQFERFIKFFRLKRTTVYRAIREYKNALKLPPPILNAAMAKNVNIMGDGDARPFGKYTEAVKKLPPPQGASEEKAVAYIEELERLRRALPKLEKPSEEPEVLGPMDAKELMKECYRFVAVRVGRLPSGTKRGAWLKTLVGMVLQMAGVSGEQAIAVIAPPPDFKAVRGRPRMH